jgi:hypothetical protein
MHFTTFIVAALASTALAAPRMKHKHSSGIASHTHHHHHHSGTGTGTGSPSGTGRMPWGYQNGSWVNPTHTGKLKIAPTNGPVTITVSPLPAPVASASAKADPHKQVTNSGVSGCNGPATITVTAANPNTVTITVPAPTASLSLSSSSSALMNTTTTAAVSVPAPTTMATKTSTTSKFHNAFSSPLVIPSPSTTIQTSKLTPVSRPIVPVVPPVVSSALAAASSIISTPPTSGSPTKRGLVYNSASLAGPFAAHNAISWAYNWSPSPAGLSLASTEFVPMLWGTDTSGFAAAAAKATHIMAFNEPDMTKAVGGSSISPGTAASLYQSAMMPFAGKAKLGAPAVTNANSQSPAMGLPWLQQWASACSGSCQVDFVPLHWYGWQDNNPTGKQQADGLKTYLTNAAKTVEDIFGAPKPLWLTEFSALPVGDVQVNADFMAEILPWLDASPLVERYSFFMVKEGNMVADNGLGKVYLA